MLRTSPLAAALAAGLLAACSADLKLPDGARVSCASDADCPDGYVCRQNQGRCFKAGGDVTAPGLVGAPVVTPGRVGATTAKVTVAFTTTEALGGDASTALVFAASGKTIALSIAEKDAAAHAYEATYVPKPATDPEGVADFVATLSDLTGNLAPASTNNAVVFDFTPPGILVDGANKPVVSVTLTPPATSPVRDVTAATVGTGVRIGFATTEFVVASGAGAPVVTLGSGGAAVTLTQVSGNGLSFVYETTALAAGLPDGPAPVSVHLTDLAGNGADASLGTVAISTKTPATPAVGTANAVLFHRVPWGSEATQGGPAFYLKGAAGSVPANATVIAYSAPLVVSAQGALVGRELGRTTAAADGSFGGDLGDPAPFQLFMGDAPDVYVAAVDAAGNVSDADGSAANGLSAALVRDVAWTATLQGKVPGRVFPNPHAFEGREVWTPTLWQFGGKPLATPTQISRKDGTGASVRGAPSWVRAGYLPLGFRAQQGATYDPVRGCRVSFGGQSWDGCDAGFFCSQWESCHGAPWTQPVPTDPEGDGDPSLGYDLTMTFAGGRGASLLHDGVDLWEWNGTSWRRFVMTDPEGDGNPPARTDHQIAYDEARQRVVLFGGKAASNGALLDDVWESDFLSWKKLCTAAPCSTTRPAARGGHQLVYDPVRKVTLLVAGLVSGGGYDPATWTWDGAVWRSVCSTGDCAAAAQRAEPGLTFDPVRGKAVLFGGTPSGGFDGRLFEWDGATWTEACTAAPCSTGAKPAGRATPTLTFDAAKARTILVGGTTGFANPECFSNWCGTEWEWDGTSWVQLPPTAGAPTSAQDVRPVYDAIRDRMVLLTVNGAASETWLWDGQSWTMPTLAAPPPPRTLYGAAFVLTGTVLTRNGYVIVGGGQLNGTAVNSYYTWNGSAWTAQAATPGAHDRTAMAQSTRSLPAGGALLFGGRSGGSSTCDTWEFSGTTWTGSPACQTPSPSARYGMAMVRATGFAGAPVVLFGGSAGNGDQNDVWNYDGTAWTQVSAGGAQSETQPRGRQGHGLLFDTARNRVLLYGGALGAIVSNVNCVDQYGGANCHDFWEWNGSAWTRVFPVDLYGDGVPDPFHLEGVAWDTRRQRGLGVVSKSGAGSMDTWWWNGGGTDRPGQLASFGFDAAQVTRPFDVLDLDVSWVGGGSGSPGGTATPGASLQIWDNRAWRTLVSSATASPSATETFHWTLSGDAALGATPVAERKRFLVGDQKGLYLGLVPAAASGQAAGMGEVVTDYVELTVRYRLGP